MNAGGQPNTHPAQTKVRQRPDLLPWWACIITNDPDLPPCAGCGRCCHLVVELSAGDRVPEEFVVEHAGVRCMDQHGNGACVALDAASQLCTIYADRPQTCRDFNRGASLCHRILARAG